MLLCFRSCCLKSSGVLVPATLTVFGMCIESDSLLSDSRVMGDEHTMGLVIAKYINVFKVCDKTCAVYINGELHPEPKSKIPGCFFFTFFFLLFFKIINTVLKAM